MATTSAAEAQSEADLTISSFNTTVTKPAEEKIEFSTKSISTELMQNELLSQNQILEIASTLSPVPSRNIKASSTVPPPDYDYYGEKGDLER